MPNGYRRGGSYQRNGRTFHRRGTSIARPRTIVTVAVVGVLFGAMLAGGGPLIAHPAILTGVVVGLAALGVGAYAGRRQLARWARRSAARRRIADQRWVKAERVRQKAAAKRWAAREKSWQHRPTLVARTKDRRPL